MSAGGGSSAGGGGGTTQAITFDADGGCEFHLDAGYGDAVLVRGTSTSLGTIDYFLEGYSAGASQLSGLQAFTNSQFSFSGVPANIFDSGLWAWSGSNQPIVVGQLYSGDNIDMPMKTTPLVNYRISFNSGPQLSCPNGDGTGTFVYSTFLTSLPYGGDVEFDFHCPSIGFDVHGCHHVRW